MRRFVRPLKDQELGYTNTPRSYGQRSIASRRGWRSIYFPKSEITKEFNSDASRSISHMVFTIYVSMTSTSLDAIVYSEEANLVMVVRIRK